MNKKTIHILSHCWVFTIAVTVTMTVYDNSNWWLSFLSMLFLVLTMGLVESVNGKNDDRRV